MASEISIHHRQIEDLLDKLKAKGLKEYQVAEKINVDPSTLSRIKKGKKKLTRPRRIALENLAFDYGIIPPWIKSKDLDIIPLGDDVVKLPMISAEVPAGFPSLEEGTIIGHALASRTMTGANERCYIVRVRGQSMEGFGIREGDYLIVDPELSFDSGRIVLAYVDDGIVCKKLVKGEDGWFLMPANDDYPPIRVKEDTRILGVVRSIIRRLV